jgi:hypothetical protein
LIARASADTSIAVGLSTELVARASADTSLATSITAANSTRLAGDQSLATEISALPQTDGVTIELDAATNLVQITATVAAPSGGTRTFNGLINVGAQPATLAGFGDLSLITRKYVVDANTSINTSVSSEASRATSAELSLTTSVSAANSLRTAADVSLTTSVSSEISSRIAGDTSLATIVSTEVSRATSAETSLDAKLNNVISNVDPAALDSLTEIVAAFQAADGDLNGAITGLTATAATNLSAEISNRIADVDAEESRAMSAELVLTNDLSSEISNRIADVNTEESRAISAELSLSTDFANIYAKKVALTGSVNGTNLAFTLANEVRANSEAIYLNGLLQFVNEDYTLTTSNGKVTGIEFIEAPLSGSKVNAYGVY